MCEESRRTQMNRRKKMCKESEAGDEGKMSAQVNYDLDPLLTPV